MTDDALRAISAAWDSYPTIGTMPDGEPIKNISGDPQRVSAVVREPSGYFCSPIAYSVRQSVGARQWFTPIWTDGLTA